MKVVFFGTPPFAGRILDFLIASGIQVVAIVTRPDRPKGRAQKLQPSAVKAIKNEKWLSIPLFQPEKASTEAFAKELKAFDADAFVVVAYGEIIKANILEIPKKGCINVHASILPKYRGAAPIQRAIMNGETKSGVTIMDMVLKMDAGAMYKVVEAPILENTTFGELEEKLCQLAGPALVEVLKKIDEGKAEKIEQDETQVTFAPKITQEDRLIDWGKDSQTLHNQIRGLSPVPGAYSVVDVGGEKKRLQIKKSKNISSHQENPEGETPEETPGGTPGQILAYGNGTWIVACGRGAIALEEIQLEGKKSLTTSEFIRGMPIPPKFSIV